ncbi:MAG: SHOCT domain-containing protein [Prevotella sp.]|nr:SHOCT domain-containing protein [Prevotella sp.]
MDIFEQCPKCGKITEGIPVYELKQQGVRTGTRFATKKVLLYIATIVMGNVIFPVVGTILGLIVAFFIAAYIEKKADQVSDSFVQTTFDSTPFEFKCPYCGNLWKRTYEKGVDFTTDFVLKWQKTCLIEDIRGEASSSRVTAIIAGIICAPCAFYCLTHLSGQSEYLLWWLLFIIGLPALFITVNSGVKSHNKSQEADDLENMSISTFRHSSYRAGNPFVGVDKPLDKMDKLKENYQRKIPQFEQNKEIAHQTHELEKQNNSESSDSDKDNLVKLDELLTAGILTEEEYAEQKNKITPSTVQSAIQTPPQRTVDAKVENNKISILHNLKLLLDSEVLTPKEFRKQKLSTLSLVSIPWGKNMTPIEILIEMNYLLDAGILTKEEFNFHKKTVLSNEQTKVWSESIKDTISNLELLIRFGVLSEEEFMELKNKLAKAAIPLAKGEDEKIVTLNNLKLLLDAGVITPEVYRKEKQSTLSNKWIPWDKNKTKYEILEEMKSLLDAHILSQEEFDFHKKALLSDNN